SKDKKYVYMPALVVQRDSGSFRNKANQQSYSDKVDYSVMKVELASPSRPANLSGGDRNAIDFFIDKQGDVFVEERYSERSNLHEVRVRRGSKWHTIYSEKVERLSFSIVGITENHKSLVVLAYDESDRRQYYTMSLKDGSFALSDINNDKHDIDDVITDNNRVVYGVRYRGFLPSYKFFDERLDKRVKNLLDKFSGNAVTIKSWSDDWKKILVYVAGSNFSGEYYLFDEKLNAQFISDSRPAIKTEHVNPIAIVNVTASDHLTIPTLLTIPKAKLSEMKNLPAVVLPHGGPRANDSIEFDWIAQALASQGYIVIQPQYRGSTGFGWSFIEAGYGEWGGKMLDDINAALDFTIEKGIVDKSRVCIVGASYGGYAALANGARTPDKYRCIVSINGIGNMWDMMKKDKFNFGRDHSWIQILDKYVDDEGADKDAYKAISPYYKADNFKAPVLLIHGEHDERVDIDQSKDMASSLKRAKKDVKYIKLKGETHYLEQNATRLKTLNAVVDFVNKHMK
ncbi:MAG TPA: alpha/beta fold hydrolase, partial [Marinagarivorans sp.]